MFLVANEAAAWWKLRVSGAPSWLETHQPRMLKNILSALFCFNFVYFSTANMQSSPAMFSIYWWHTCCSQYAKHVKYFCIMNIFEFLPSDWRPPDCIQEVIVTYTNPSICTTRPRALLKGSRESHVSALKPFSSYLDLVCLFSEHPAANNYEKVMFLLYFGVLIVALIRTGVIIYWLFLCKNLKGSFSLCVCGKLQSDSWIWYHPHVGSISILQWLTPPFLSLQACFTHLSNALLIFFNAL